MSRSTSPTSCAPSLPPPPAAPERPPAAAYASPETPRYSRPSRLPEGWGKLAWPLLALAALLLFNFLFTPGFLRLNVSDGRVYGSLIDVLKNTAPSALAGLGMTLVIATGGVDLAVGATMAIAGATAALMVKAGAPLPLVLAASLGSGLVCGAWNGLLVSIFRIQPIIATLLLMVAGRGIAQLMTDGQIIQLGGGASPAFRYVGTGYLLGLPFQITIVAAAVLLTTALVRLTALGLFIESVGDNETASRFAGINDRFVKFAVYVFSGLCAAVAGVIVTSNTASADANNVGVNLELDAILAAVIGGTALAGGRFYLLGTMIGALIIQTLTTTILTRGIPVQYTLVVKAVVVLGVCLLQAPKVQRSLSSAWGHVLNRGGAA